MLAFGTDAENKSVPYPEVQEEAPDSNPDGRALEAESDGLKVEDLRRVLVRVGNLLECLYDGGMSNVRYLRYIASNAIT